MDKATLETATGEYVYTAHFPTFSEPPQVLVWGTRVFCYHLAGFDGDPPTYRECFAVTVVEGANEPPTP